MHIPRSGRLETRAWTCSKQRRIVSFNEYPQHSSCQLSVTRVELKIRPQNASNVYATLLPGAVQCLARFLGRGRREMTLQRVGTASGLIFASLEALLGLLGKEIR